MAGRNASAAVYINIIHVHPTNVVEAVVETCGVVIIIVMSNPQMLKKWWKHVVGGLLERRKQQ